jgi:hypothetical protein
MTVSQFFDKYVNHTDDCQKGITSPTCTCGLMKNLPHIFSLALDAERNQDVKRYPTAKELLDKDGRH